MLRTFRGAPARPPATFGLVAFVVAALALVGSGPRPAGTIVEPWIDTSNREAVVVAWETESTRPVPTMDWTGARDGCRPGSASRELALATVRRVNFYRGMAGVPAGVRLHDDYSAKAQHAALAMSATGRLSHTPDESFACLDDEAVEAAANSNLYLGRTGPYAIDGYIEDPGERNADVGHRNTILHPPTREIGVGHVAGDDERYPSNALWVFDDLVFEANPGVREPEGFVAWPPRGHVPAELVHPRWSFGLSGADFTDATVSMTVGGREVPVEVVARLSLEGYVPQPIVVWEPDPSWATLRGDLADGVLERDLDVDVTVDGVEIDGETQRFTYRVTLIDPRAGERLGVSEAAEVAVRAAGRAARLLTVAAPGLSG